MNMMKVLVTGFEPLKKIWTGKETDETLNPSFEAVKQLPSEIAGAQIITAQIPTSYQGSFDTLFPLLERERPDIVISVGQAARRPNITVEKVAINLDESKGKPDNSGDVRCDQFIFEDGHDAYFSNLPVREIVEAIKQEQIPAEISYSAGTYICNHVMYGVLYLIHQKYPHMHGGFIHVPNLPEQAVMTDPPQASMALSLITQAIRIAIETVVKKHQ